MHLKNSGANSKTLEKRKRADIRRVIIDKIGLNYETAMWILSITDKHHIWIANQIKKNPKLFFSRHKIDFIKIMEWKKVDQFHQIKNLSFEEALHFADEYSLDKTGFIRSHNSLDNKKVYLDLKDYKWVKLESRRDCSEEGRAMSHCLTGVGHSSSIIEGKSSAYSLRDKYNMPHVTIEISKKDGAIKNLFGSCNNTIQTDYVEYVCEFLRHNSEWKKIISSHAPSVFSFTLLKIIIVSAKEGDHKLIKKILKRSTSSVRSYMHDGLYGTRLASCTHEVSELLGLNRRNMLFFKFNKKKLKMLMKTLREAAEQSK